MKVEGRRQKAETTLVCFALKEEAAPFRKIAANRPDVSILIVGIGRQNAEKAVRQFLTGGASACRAEAFSEGLVLASRSPHTDQRRLAGTLAPPGLVLTCGFAGGLDPDLKIGDVVFELSDSALRAPHSALQAKLLAAGAKPAKLFCADRIATTVAEKKKLHDETGADAVEMESAAIHTVCREQGIPCITIRVISDTAHEDLPLDFNLLAKPDKSLDFGKLAWTIAKSPGKIPALMELGKKTNFAAQRLAEILLKIL